MSLEMRGDYDDAIRAMERAIEIAGPAPIFLGALAHIFARAGRPADAGRLIEQLNGMVKQRYVSPYNFAIAHTGLGQTDEALAAIEQSLEEHNAWMCFLPIDPRFDTIRGDARFVSLVERYGLPARVETDV
jgi:Flp pilus assembly protein TadD